MAMIEVNQHQHQCECRSTRRSVKKRRQWLFPLLRIPIQVVVYKKYLYLCYYGPLICIVFIHVLIFGKAQNLAFLPSTSTSSVSRTTLPTPRPHKSKSKLFLSSKEKQRRQQQQQQYQNNLLAKTFESFKLSDVYMMEGRLQSNIRNWNEAKRICIDPNTGSCLFTLDERALELELDELGELSQFHSKKSNHNDNTTSTCNKSSDSYDSNICSSTTMPMTTMMPIPKLMPPSIVSRCDWICDELAFGSNICELLNDIEHNLHDGDGDGNDERDSLDLDSFSLDYISMGRKSPSQSSTSTTTWKCSNNNNDDDDVDSHCDNLYYTSKSLSYRVAQLLLPATVALNPKEAKVKLLIIDTPAGIFLGRKRKFLTRGRDDGYGDGQDHNSDSDKIKNFMTKWSSRPFQYSSAVNPTIAVIAVDLIHDLVLVQHQKNLSSASALTTISTSTSNTSSSSISNPEHIFSMADITCGSGTFLALAMGHGMTVYGFDINEKCVAGARKNLEFLYGQDLSNDRSCITVQDSSSTDISTCSCTANAGEIGTGNCDPDNVLFDCVVSNLPWGQNTKMSMEENKLILGQLSGKLTNGAYCAFITKDDKLQSLMNDLDFFIIDSANVPQSSFVLPTGKRGKGNKSDRGNSSNCVITIAQYRTTLCKSKNIMNNEYINEE